LTWQEDLRRAIGSAKRIGEETPLAIGARGPSHWRTAGRCSGRNRLPTGASTA